MDYPTQFSMSGKLNKEDMEYHASILHNEINFDWSRIEFKYQDESIFFPSAMQVPFHGKYKTRKLMTCLDPTYRIVVQCQNIVYVLNGHEFEQPNFRVLERLTGRNDYDTKDTQRYIIEESIQVGTDEIVNWKC